MNLGDLVIGTWSDPHMLAGFMATFCHAVGAGGGPSAAYVAQRQADAWARYATASNVHGKPSSLTILGGSTLHQGGGGDDLAAAVVAWQVQADDLHEKFRAYDRAGNRVSHTVVRRPITATARMFATTWANPIVWFSPGMLWLGRTWIYADIVAPWCTVTDDAILKPRQFCKPIPSPVPVDVREAIDACLLAGEVKAARSYYQAWRDVQAQENPPCER
jgi:hypothetical protein